MTLIDGKALADKMAIELKTKVDDLKSAGVTPGLVVILVGENPASQVYVRNKERRASAAGFHSEVIRLPEETTEIALLNLIAQLNQDDRWHGILVQLPLPAHISEEKSYSLLTQIRTLTVFTQPTWDASGQVILS